MPLPCVTDPPVLTKPKPADIMKSLHIGKEMSLIQLSKLKNGVRNRQFVQICSLICLLTSALLLAVYSFLTIQRFASLKDRMSTGADVLALRIQDKLSGVQSTSMYLASLNSIGTLLVQENPSLTTLSEYDNVLCSVSGSDSSIELLLHKSERILISDYGLSSYETYLDQAFLEKLLTDKKQPDRWLLRSYRQNIYTGAKTVLSYIRSLPLSSVQNNGYIIVNQSMGSLAKTAAASAQADLGDYAVWMENILLASSADEQHTRNAQVCRSGLEIPIRAAYWMPFGSMLSRSLPSPLISLCIWVMAMVVCAVTARIICRQRMARLDMLVHEMGGEWTLEEDYDDQVDQLYGIFESLSLELSRARQTTREGMPLLQERLIGELLRTPVSIAERRESLDRCGIWLKNPYFAVVTAALDEGAFDEQRYLLVRRNVQTQLSALGEVYSTYGDGSSILFLVNAADYANLGEKLEALCETMHDALESFLSVDVVFSIGLCTEGSPTPHDAYLAAHDRLSTLRMMEDQSHEAVLLTHSNQTPYLHTENIRRLCGAIAARDAAAVETVCDDLFDRYFMPEMSLQEVSKRAMVFLTRTWASLTETEDQYSLETLNTAVKRLQQQRTADEIRSTLREWCCSLISRSEEAMEESNQYVEDTLAFIHENYMHSLSVPEIAEKVSVNPIYLNRLFKAATGKTLSNYLNQYRCDHACTLLEETQATVNEISDACGFSEVRSFIRFFKKYYEETPTEYRRRLKG